MSCERLTVLQRTYLNLRLAVRALPMANSLEELQLEGIAEFALLRSGVPATETSENSTQYSSSQHVISTANTWMLVVYLSTRQVESDDHSMWPYDFTLNHRKMLDVPTEIEMHANF